MAITRRQFLQGAGAAGAAGAVGLALAKEPWRHRDAQGGTSAAPASAPGAGILVLLTLYGGNDGINTVIPFEDARYLGARRDLGHIDGNVLPLAEGLALNPALGGFKRLWDAEQLGV